MRAFAPKVSRGRLWYITSCSAGKSYNFSVRASTVQSVHESRNMRGCYASNLNTAKAKVFCHLSESASTMPARTHVQPVRPNRRLLGTWPCASTSLCQQCCVSNIAGLSTFNNALWQSLPRAYSKYHSTATKFYSNHSRCEIHKQIRTYLRLSRPVTARGACCAIHSIIMIAYRSNVTALDDSIKKVFLFSSFPV